MWILGFLVFVGVIVYMVKLGKTKAIETKVPPMQRKMQEPPTYDYMASYAKTIPVINAPVWNGNGVQITVGRYTISDPMTYASDGKISPDEPSCINRHLKVGVPVAEPKGALGYWPHYSKITPDQRANYLKWLESGKKAPLHDIGYAFIYFYGFERRALIDRQDAQPIVLETLRLLNTYTESRSFQKYLSSFVVYVIASTGLAKLTEAWYRRIFEEKLSYYDDDVLSVALAWIFVHKKPLTPTLAYRVAQNDPRSPRSVVQKRLPEECKELFVKKFEARYGEKIFLKTAKNNRMLEYYPASAALISERKKLKPIALVNVLGIQSQFKSLVEIWGECIAELKAASSFVAKGYDLSTREAYEKLPAELRKNYDHPDKPEWQAIIAGQNRDDGIAIVPVSALAKLRGIPERAKLTLKQSADMAKGARDVGFLLAPDPWTVQRPYLWNESIAIVPFDGEEDPTADNFFHAAGLILELGIGMAAADGKIDREEVIHVSLVLRNQFRFSQSQARLLEAFREILVKAPPSLKGIGRRVQKILTTEQRESLGHFIVGVAASDGHIAREELTALRGIYSAMGLLPSTLDDLVRQLALKSSEPVVIRQAETARKGEDIPAPAPKGKENIIALDMELVAQITRETMAVAEMIGKAMGELAEDSESLVDDTVESGRMEQVTAPIVELSAEEGIRQDMPRYTGLPSRFHQVLGTLTAQKEWSREAFNNMAREHGLMPAGMLEEINSWSDEFLGDYLIEEGDTYVVNLGLLGENHE